MALSFLKTGAESAALAAKAAAEQQAYRDSLGKLWRFWLKAGEGGKPGEEARITFVDGNLNKDGFLTPPRYYEHNIYLNGNWNNFFVCPEKTDPNAGESCPICVSGDRPALVSLFTIIDHRTYISKDKKPYVNTKKLLVAKPQTFEILNKHAIKRQGLAGCTFDVSRVGDKAAAVGSMFEFVEKKPVEELKKVYIIEKLDPKTNTKAKVSNFTPADYEKEITYRTGDELRKAGLGKPQEASTDDTPQGEPTDYSNEL